MVRYHLQRVRTGEWLSRDFPVRGGAQSLALSGPGQVMGAVDGREASRIAGDGLPFLDKWSTAIYAAEGRRIIHGGIIQHRGFTPDGLVAFTAPGFCSYPTGMPWTAHPLPSGAGTLDPTIPLETIYAVLDGQYRNPIRIFRAIWLYIQAQPRSNIGLEVDDIGGWHEQLSVRQGTLTIGTNQEPYGLSWWANTDLGAELNNLAANTPFDYNELHSFSDDMATVKHRLQIGTPRLGGRREDLRFAVGENIVVPMEFEESEYANEIWGIGKGNGAASIRVSTAVDDGRLRRPRTYTDKTSSRERITTQVRDQLTKLLDPVEISTMVVVDHRNAPLSALSVGDEILAPVEHHGRTESAMWVRIVGIDYTDGSGHAALSVQRASAFNYSTTFAEGADFGDIGDG